MIRALFQHGRVVLIAATILTTAVGCGPRPSLKLPPVYPVSGSVRIDGKPLARGRILMEGENDAAAGLAPVEVAIENGSYELLARAGKMRVRITAPEEFGDPDETGLRATRETVAAAFNSESALLAEVTSAGSNRFDFDVKSR